MAATSETQLVNMALARMGQATIDDIDGTDVNEERCALVYDQERDELLLSGPKYGWKFAKHTYHGIDRESFTITGFASASATTTTVTATHTLVAGDKVTITGTTSYDGEYVVNSVSTTVSFVITATFVADDATGTAYWTSEEYAYRYLVPTSRAVRQVSVGGVELTDWVQYGSYIVTNEESDEVDMEIVKAVTDVTLFPDYFVKVLVLRLAIKLHYQITQDLNAIDRLERELSYEMPNAIAMDERRQYVQESSSSWVDAGNNTDMIE